MIRVEYQPMFKIFSSWEILGGIALSIQEAFMWCRQRPGAASIMEVYILTETNRVVATRSWNEDL